MLYYIAAAFLSVMVDSAVAGTIYLPDSSQEWVIGNREEYSNLVSTQYVKKSKTIQDRSEMLTIQTLPTTKVDLQNVLEKLRSETYRRCPDAKWSVYKVEPLSIIYEWQTGRCAGRPDQVEIGRILKERDDIHRISYTRLAPQFGAFERARLLRILTNAYIGKDDANEIPPMLVFLN